jgi:hypothetical protein
MEYQRGGVSKGNWPPRRVACVNSDKTQPQCQILEVRKQGNKAYGFCRAQPEQDSNVQRPKTSDLWSTKSANVENEIQVRRDEQDQADTYIMENANPPAPDHTFSETLTLLLEDTLVFVGACSYLASFPYQDLWPSVTSCPFQ